MPTYGYHDVTADVVTAGEVVVDSETGGKQSKEKKSAEEVAADPELNKTSTVVKDFVVDFSSKTYKPLMEQEVNGLGYRYVYSDKARLSVVVQGIDAGSDSLLDDSGELHAYYHTDYLGTTDYLTSAVNSKVIAWTSYNEWGEITHSAVLKCGQRELDLVKEYATHDYDAVLSMYYAKARFYDADNRRFTAQDSAKDGINWYVYCRNNPVIYVDWLGEATALLADIVKAYGATYAIDNSKHQATVSLHSVTKTYTSAMGDDAVYQNQYTSMWMADTLAFGHDWNYVYNIEIETTHQSDIFDENGYVKNQTEKVTGTLRYGVTTMYNVGCELIAIFNALNRVNYHTQLSSVADYYEHHSGMLKSGYWGTWYGNIDDYFNNFSCITAEKVSKSEIESSLNYANAAIISFNNANSLSYHTVMMAKTSATKYTVYNWRYGRDTIEVGSVDEMLGYENDGKSRHFLCAYIITNTLYKGNVVEV